MSPMRVVMTGGGTGGHLYPLLALAELLKTKPPGWEIAFIGTEKNIEGRVVPREGYNIFFVDVEGIMGRGIAGKLRALYKLPSALKKALEYIRRFRPDIVVGSGGYVSAPGVVAAWLEKIPSVLLEQNTMPGRANRFLARFADGVCVTDPESSHYFPARKVFVTGNPVRQTITKGSRQAGYKLFSLAEDRFTIFVFGGSRGARKLNDAVCEALKYLGGLRDKVQFLHQTGQDDHERVRECFRKLGFSGTVTPYIYQMPEAYAVADLVVCRSGASTIAELSATAKPAILVPYPYAAADHQLKNALRLEGLKAAEVIRDQDLTGQTLAERIQALYEDEARRAELQKNIAAFSRPDAAEKVYEVMRAVLKRYQKDV